MNFVKKIGPPSKKFYSSLFLCTNLKNTKTLLLGYIHNKFLLLETSELKNKGPGIFFTDSSTVISKVKNCAFLKKRCEQTAVV